jgi:hypothetical protein
LGPKRNLAGLQVIENKVARDGIEPPTPAFSGLRSTVRPEENQVDRSPELTFWSDGAHISHTNPRCPAPKLKKIQSSRHFKTLIGRISAPIFPPQGGFFPNLMAFAGCAKKEHSPQISQAFNSKQPRRKRCWKASGSRRPDASPIKFGNDRIAPGREGSRDEAVSFDSPTLNLDLGDEFATNSQLRDDSLWRLTQSWISGASVWTKRGLLEVTKIPRNFEVDPQPNSANCCPSPERPRGTIPLTAALRILKKVGFEIGFN